MRLIKIFIIVFGASIIAIPARGQEQNEQEKKIFEYIYNNDIFSLLDVYPSIKDSINIAFQSFTEAFVYKCLGNPQASMYYIEETLKEQDKIDDNTKVSALVMLVDNLMQIQEYNEAGNLMKYIIEITGLKEFEPTYNEILKYQNLPKRHFTRSDENDELNFKYKKVGRGEVMYTSCKINGREREAIFDTGCSISKVSLSFALENNLYMTNNLVPLHGIGGVSEGYIGVIDSIQVGNMIYRDVVCAIQGSITPFDSIADVFLGLDLIKETGEFHILPQKEKIIFQAHDTSSPDTDINMAIIGNTPYIKAYTENERLIFLFDSGNVGVDMYESYYGKHRDKIVSEYTKTEISVGGIAGISQQEVYILPQLPLKIGKTTIDINNINIFTNSILHNINDMKDVDGNLGIGFIKACNKIKVNFRKSLIEIE